MNLENYYWYFQGLLNKGFCSQIIDIGKSLDKTKGTINTEEDTDKQEKVLKSRNSDIVFIDNEKWIYDELWHWVQVANQNAKWNFDIDWCEAAQFTVYNKDQHYDWHCDSFKLPYQSPDQNFNNKIRKLSCTLLLNDPNEYKGGEFEFDFRNKKKSSNIITVKELNKQGSLLVFPSHIWHRVKPVIKGTRYSLVLWFLGKPFK